MSLSTSALPAPGDTMDLLVSDLTVDGGAIAKQDGLVIFLDRGLPGETVHARIDTVKKRFVHAEVLRTVTPSPFETPSFCPHGTECGGCAWTNLAYPRELAWKANHIRQNMQRIGGIEIGREMGLCPDSPPRTGALGTHSGECSSSFLTTHESTGDFALPIAASPRTERYRNKTEFAFVPDQDEVAMLGLRKRGSHEIVEITDCLLARSSLAPLLAFTRSWVNEKNITAWDGQNGFLRFLVVRQPEALVEDTQQYMVEIITTKVTKGSEGATLVENFGKALMQELPEITSFVHSTRSQPTPVAYGDRMLSRTGVGFIEEQVGTIMLQAPVQAFLQVNTQAAAILYATIREFAQAKKEDTVWDLYCGVGGIALTIAQDAGTVRGFENNKDAVRWAKRNATRLEVGNCTFVDGDVATAIKAETTKPDIIIMDPPRAGMTDALIGMLMKLRPRVIVSVSCDPATQARDVAKLSKAYTVDEMRAVDLFPHTVHVESVVLLRLR